MRTKIGMVLVIVFALALLTGCGGQGSSGDAGGATGDEPDAVGSWKFSVDIDNATLGISTPFSTSTVTQVDGHTVEIYNGPGGCLWSDTTNTLSCEIVVKNLDSDECMHNVRTRLNGSTNPSAIITGADYVWPGPAIVPDSAQPINGSGYCITEPSPDAAGPVEGCSNTWQESIPSGGIATQYFEFTNVPSGTFSFYTQIMATYQSCSAPAGMALIPAGCFDMGDSSDGCGFSYECPVHNVCITSDFKMDVHEVTNAEYATCVGDGDCTAPSNSSSATRGSYYGNSSYNNFPVIYVDWSQATDYCTWAGKRLASESEWEFAARGGLSEKRYPHGDSLSCSDANYGRQNSSYDCWDYAGLANDTHQVESYNANGYGLHDMAGNVWEWTNDWYLDTYYSISPVNNPPGPGSGTYRMVRGASWYDTPSMLSVAHRYGNNPANRDDDKGFRCAGD